MTYYAAAAIYAARHLFADREPPIAYLLDALTRAIELPCHAAAAYFALLPLIKML